MKQLDKFTRQYLETALWSSNDESDESGGEPFDCNYSIEDIADEAIDAAIADCEDFQWKYGHLYGDPGQAGHDFWLTRNGHGAGFWDGDYQEPEATILTNAAQSCGNIDPYLGDDGLIYFG